jgi:uncharacterized protein (DUF1697 family)
MPKPYVALLRGINVGGHKMVAMADLRDLATRLGFLDVVSLLQSGNLLLRADGRPVGLEKRLEAEARKRLSLEIDFFVRGADEWADLIARNPLHAEAKRDPAHLVVVFMKDPPDRRQVEALQDAIPGHEIVKADGRHAYVFYPDGIGRSRLTHGLIEKTLGTRGTARNWNTVLKLGKLVTNAVPDKS